MSAPFYRDAIEFYNRLGEKIDIAINTKAERVSLRYKLNQLYKEYEQANKLFETNPRKEQAVAEYERLCNMFYQNYLPRLDGYCEFAFFFESVKSYAKRVLADAPVDIDGNIIVDDTFEDILGDIPEEMHAFWAMCKERLPSTVLMSNEESWLDYLDELDQDVVEAALRVYRRVIEVMCKEELINGVAPIDDTLDAIKEEEYDLFNLKSRINQLEYDLGSMDAAIERIENEVEAERLAYEREHVDELIAKRAAWNQLSREERVERMLVPNEGESSQECLHRVFAEKNYQFNTACGYREYYNDYVTNDYLCIHNDPEVPDLCKDAYVESMAAGYEKRWLVNALLPIHIQAVEYAKQKVDPDARRGVEFMEGTPKAYGKRFVNDYAKYVCDWLKDSEAQTKLYHDFQKNCAYMAACGDLMGDIYDLIDTFGLDAFDEKYKKYSYIRNAGCEGTRPLVFPYFKNFVAEDGEKPGYRDLFTGVSGDNNSYFMENRPARTVKEFTAALANLLIWNNNDMYYFGLKTKFLGMQFHRYYDFYEEKTGESNLMPGEEGYGEFIEKQVAQWSDDLSAFSDGCDSDGIPHNMYIIFKEYLSAWVNFYRAEGFFSHCHDMIFDFAKDFRNHLILDDEVIEDIRELKAPCFPYSKLEEADISFLLPDLMFIETAEILADGDMMEIGIF